MKNKASKSFIVFCIALCLSTVFSAVSAADVDKSAEFLSIMCRAAACGDLEAGHAAEICRKSCLSPGDVSISFDELYLLARVIYVEAGSEDIPEYWRQMVGEVVMNRIASPEFPNTLEEVIYEPGQYAEVMTERFKYFTYPSPQCVETALRLLSGEKTIPSSVVFQANFRQGGGVYAAFASENHICSYLCYTAHPELYADFAP